MRGGTVPITEPEGGSRGKTTRRKPQAQEASQAVSYAMTAAVALLVVIVGMGIVQNRIHVPGLERAIQTIASSFENKEEHKPQVLVGTEIAETQEAVIGDTQNMGETYTETLDLIPIESMEAGDVRKIENDVEEDRKISEKPESEETNAKAEQSEYYIVKAGDTLTSICNKVYGSTEKMNELKDCNHLEDADDLRVDQKLLLP